MLGDVSDYGDEYDADEELGDPELRGERLYRADEGLSETNATAAVEPRSTVSPSSLWASYSCP